MSSPVQKVLTQAVGRILRPLLKLWLRHGMSYQAFEELARWVMVDIAVREFPLHGKRQTDSRVSVITGLTRHQVAHYRKLELEDSPVKAKANRATRVLTGWLTDPDFHESGCPSSLRVDGHSPTFKELVERYGGDVPHVAIKDELVSIRAVVFNEADYTVSLLSKGLVPCDDEQLLLEIIGRDCASFFATLEHNLHAPVGRKWFQKKVSYGELSKEGLRHLRVDQGRCAQELLEKFNTSLKALQEQDQVQAGPKVRGGWGIYYFEDEQS